MCGLILQQTTTFCSPARNEPDDYGLKSSLDRQRRADLVAGKILHVSDIRGDPGAKNDVFAFNFMERASEQTSEQTASVSEATSSPGRIH